MDFINRKIGCNGPRAFRHSRPSPIAAVNIANGPDKPLILLYGGPGRTPTSNQAVMSAVLYPERSVKIVTSANVQRRLFTVGCGVSLVIHWLGDLSLGIHHSGTPKFFMARSVSICQPEVPPPLRSQARACAQAN